MGADEKHAATYHGGKYTPTPDEVREQWAYTHSPRDTTTAEAAAEFDRMITKIRAEAWAEGHAAGEGSVKAKDNPYKENQ